MAGRRRATALDVQQLWNPCASAGARRVPWARRLRPMSAFPLPRRGKVALLRLLHQGTWDVRGLELPGFRSWLDRHLQRWSVDPVFLQRAAIRDLRRRCPGLDSLEARIRGAEAADREAATFRRLEALEQEIEGAARAVAGLADALSQAGAERRRPLADKLERFRAAHATLAGQREELLRAGPERRELLRLRDELAGLRAATGLEAAEAELARLQREQGRGSGRSGADFEEGALEVTREQIVPDVARRHALGAAFDRVEVLRGVTLGAAATELDLVVVVRGVAAEEPARVLAVVEVKRNVNDLGHGFRRRQQNLAWLRGDTSRYAPDDFRTRTFPTGHFDRPVAHPHPGGHVVLDAASFASLAPDPATGWVLPGLWFVTREGPLWGAGGAALSRIAHRVATDPRWEPDDPGYLSELLRWCRSLTHEVEAPDVLGLYAGHADAHDQLLLVPRVRPPPG